MRRNKGQRVGMPTIEKVEGFIENHLFNLGATPHAIAKAIAFREDGELLLSKEIGVVINSLDEEERIKELVDYMNCRYKLTQGSTNDSL